MDAYAPRSLCLFVKKETIGIAKKRYPGISAMVKKSSIVSIFFLLPILLRGKTLYYYFFEK